MTVYPAIDVLDGRLVRLAGGDPAGAIVYPADPVGAAEEWKRQGAAWVHLVSLDAAFGRSGVPLDLIRDVASTGIRVQYGGGIRSKSDALIALAAGASRVVIGTAAVADPDMAASLACELGRDRVAVALDSRRGMVAVSGWRVMTAETPLSLGGRLAEGGVRHVLYTDAERDGRMCGPSVQAAVLLAESTGLEVIASGGVSSAGDIASLARTGRIAGVVAGKALYEGALQLAEALAEAGGGVRPDAEEEDHSLPGRR